jgi:DNA-binding response OmpR family regulator
VRAVLRRTARAQAEPSPVELTWGGLKVDLPGHLATVDGQTVHLTPTELRILTVLMQYPGRVFSRDEVIRRVFPDDYEGFDRAVDSHIANLRRKLEAAAPSARYIQTVYGAGYRFGHA